MSAFFVLMPGTWPDADQHLCRPLVGRRQGRAALTPYVAVARGVAGGRFDLVRREGLSAGDGKGLLLEAARDLQSAPCTWQVAETRGLFFKKPAMLRPVMSQPVGKTPDPMDDLSAEQILNPAGLAQAAGMLGTSELIASVPKRGWLLLAPCRPGELPQMMKMHAAAAGVFGRAGPDGLSPYGFFLKAGQLVGINVVERGGGYLSLLAPEDGEWLL